MILIWPFIALLMLSACAAEPAPRVASAANPKECPAFTKNMGAVEAALAAQGR